MKRRIAALILCITTLFSLIGCGAENQESKQQDPESVTLNIAYQYGLAYAPLIIVQEQKLIESSFKEATGKDVTVTWTKMDSGADINTGFASGSIDVGFMGVAPAITGVTKGTGYKIFTNLSGQEHGFMTNDKSISSFDDLIGSDHQIALVNVGSIQHIILAKALSDSGYDPHVLDSNIVAMKHPDGMTALETGNIACHLTSSPYIYQEREENNLYEINAINKAWPKENSFIVGVVSEKLYDDDQELYLALCDAINESINYINDHTEDAAKVTCEYNGNTAEDELKYLQAGAYTAQTKGIFELATFMADANFIDAKPESYADLTFNNVVGD